MAVISSVQAWSLSPVHWSLKEVTAPTVEPITLAEAKLHLRIDQSLEDAAIATRIVSARQQVETETGRLVARGTYDYAFDAFSADGVVLFPRTPVSSLTSLTLYDADNVAAVIASSNYLADLESEPPRILIDYTLSSAWWPTSGIRPYRAGVVRFIGGPDETSLGSGVPKASPAWAVQAIYVLLDWWRTKDPDAKAAYDRLINLHRIEGVC